VLALHKERREGWLCDPMGWPEYKQTADDWHDVMAASELMPNYKRGYALPVEVHKLDESMCLAWELHMSILCEQTPDGGESGKVIKLQNCHKLRPSKELKEMGKVPMLHLHPAGVLVSGGNVVWTGEYMQDRPIREQDVAALRAMLLETGR
jgi:hypothetical protein